MSKQETMTRVWKVILILVAASLIFAGPTYIVYLLKAVGVPHIYSIAVGFVLLLMGLVMTYRLVKAGEIS